MSGRMNWSGAAMRDRIRDRGSEPMESHDQTPRRRPKRRGITNAQAKYLARLQRELGVAYTGNGMSLDEASAAIKDCIFQIEVKRRAATG
jgi:hypothetical protein